MEEIFSDCCDSLKQLINQYENKPHIHLKIKKYICLQLPTLLKNMDDAHQLQQKRIEDLTNEQENFINNFLRTNRFFYVASTDCFFYYDGLTYKIYCEDDILYKVLTKINTETHLSNWKSKTKNSIMKKIKENNLLKSIPESETIQNILDFLYPSFFSTKQEAKYFLTIIGDNILKKNKNYFYLINQKSKEFIDRLEYFCKHILGQYSLDSFRYKYYEQDYQLCRIVNIHDSIKNNRLWEDFLNSFYINLICVACHYSIRYSNSDEYAKRDNALNDSVFYLKNNSPKQIIDMFTEEYLIVDSGHKFNGLTWKDMSYLWKHFLDRKRLPTPMFKGDFRDYILNKFSENNHENNDSLPIYNETTEKFVGIYSKHLPSIECFITFWKENMVNDDDEDLLEIEEIALMFKRWNNNISNLSESQILDLIRFYFPCVIIENDKYIQKYKCSLWDKKNDIDTAMRYMLEENLNVYDAYNYYCKLFSGSQNMILVSKKYFENYISVAYPDVIL